MAHDIEMTIREKVYQVEQSPVAWGKDSAWSRIGHEAAGRTHARFFYYAAASLILAMALFFSFEWIREKQLTQRLESLQLAIDQQLSELVTPGDNNASTEGICASPVVAKTSTKEIRKSVQKIEHHVLLAIQLPDEKVERVTLSEMSVVPAPPPDQNVAVTIVEPVHAIFGVDIKPPATVVTKTGKKLRFRMFRSDEDSEPFTNDREYVNLVARINKK